MTYFNDAAISHLEKLPPAWVEAFALRGISRRLDALCVSPGDLNSAGLSSVRSVFPLLLSLLARLGRRRGAKALARRLRRVLRTVFEQEKSALIAAVKDALRRSPEWQAQVYEDLGGEAALQRWDARFLKSFAQQPEDNYDWLDDDPSDWPAADLAPTAPKRGPRHRRAPVLDRDGLFKWAVIPAGRRQPREREVDLGGSWHDAACQEQVTRERPALEVYTGPWPIDVRPGDLLGAPEDMPDDNLCDQTAQNTVVSIDAAAAIAAWLDKRAQTQTLYLQTYPDLQTLPGPVAIIDTQKLATALDPP